VICVRKTRRILTATTIKVKVIKSERDSDFGGRKGLETAQQRECVLEVLLPPRRHAIWLPVARAPFDETETDVGSS